MRERTLKKSEASRAPKKKAATPPGGGIQKR